MPRTQKLAFKALAIGAIPAGLLFYHWGTSLPWWVYLIVCLFFAGPTYNKLLQWEAAGRIIDEDKE